MRMTNLIKYYLSAFIFLQQNASYLAFWDDDGEEEEEEKQLETNM